MEEESSKRYAIGTGEGGNPERVEDYYRCVYFKSLDLTINCIENRFDQPGYQIYSRLESLLVKAANKLDYEEDIDFVVKFYGEDLSKDQLKVQLDILAANLPVMTERYDLPSLLSQLKAMSHAQNHCCTKFVL